MRFTRDSDRKDPPLFRGIFWLLVFGAGMFFLGYLLPAQYTSPKPRKAPLPDGAQPIPTSRPKQVRVEAVLEGEGGPERPHDKPVPPYLTDETILKKASPDDPLDAFPLYLHHLLYQSLKKDLDALTKEAEPAAEQMAMVEWPAGTPVTLAGAVQDIEADEKLGIPAVGIPAAWKYEIKDDKGRLYLVYTPYEMLGVSFDDTVNVVGRYYRAIPYTPAAERKTGEQRPTPVIVAREVDGSHLLGDPSCLKDVQDRVMFREPKPFYYLVDKVRGMTHAQLKAQHDPGLTDELLMRHPERGRGRAVGIQGVFILAQRQIKPPNIAGIKSLYWCPLRTPDGNQVWVFTLEKPDGFEKHDVVKAYGLFMKIEQYTSRRSFEYPALVVIARRLVPVYFERSTHLGVLLVIIGAVTLLALVIAVRIERHRSRAFGRHVRSVSARSRPKDLDRTARTIAQRHQQRLDEAQNNKPPPPDDRVE